MEGAGMSHSPKFTVILSAAVDAHGTIGVESLATAAHSHGHRTLARLFGRMQTRARERDTPLLRRVSVVRDASSAPGARALLNAYGITPETKLNTSQTIFLYCHRLGLPLPYIRPPYKCSPRCQAKLEGALQETMPHGYHQTQCNISHISTMRHNAWLDVASKQLRKWCGISSILGQHLRHSETNKKTIDGIFMDPARPEQWPTCCDNTCINPMLPSFVRNTFAVTEYAAEAKKIDKHEKGCRSI